MSDLRSLGQTGTYHDHLSIVSSRIDLAVSFFQQIGWQEITLKDQPAGCRYFTCSAGFPAYMFCSTRSKSYRPEIWEYQINKESLTIIFFESSPDQVGKVIQSWATENNLDNGFRVEKTTHDSVRIFIPELFGFHIIVAS